MDKRTTSLSRYKKLAALVVGIFTLGNFLLLVPLTTPGAASQEQTPAGGHTSSFCIPIPFIFSCKSPTPTPTPKPKKCIPIPIILPCASPTPIITNTPGKKQTPTPTQPQFTAAGTFTLTASEIVATNAHLNLSDVLHPVLTFANVTIQGMHLQYLSMTLSASGVVSGSGVAIKTSVFRDLVTALSGFTDKADLLKLLVGGTVKTLVMDHVNLQIDRYIQMDSLTVNGLSVK